MVDSVVVLGMRGRTCRDVLGELGNLLYRKGYAKQGYTEALLEREHQFPTGLKLRDGLNVSISHADAKWGLKPVVAVGVLERCVQFRNIENPEEEIPVRMAFVVVMPSPEKHLALLRNLVQMFQDGDTLKALLLAEKSDEVVSVLREKHILNGEGEAPDSRGGSAHT